MIVLAIFLRPKVAFKKVLSPELVCAEASTMSPEPAGVDHDPSPRQKVVAEADVPEFKFATGRLPVTPVDSGKPVRLVATPEAGVPNAGVVNVLPARVVAI